MLEEAFTLSIREDNWKYIRPLSPDREIPAWMANKDIESGLMKTPQLFNLSEDIGERNNLAESNPEKVEDLEKKLSQIVERKSIRN